MGPAAGLSLLVALYIGATSGGLISAILLKFPGTPSSITTTFDGGPMMDKGEGIKALGVGVVFSFLGTIFSIAALIFIAPWLAKVALSFGPHEYFGIAIFSLTLIATRSSGSMVKGLFAGVIGFAIATVGIAPVDAVRRFTFGIPNLNSGFDLLVVLVGVFAISEIIKVAEAVRREQKTAVGQVSMRSIKGFGFSMKEFFEQIPNVFRSALIGLGIRILPGIGGGTSNIVAYIAAKKRSKHPEKFGKGCIDGIVAPETANNAGIGGAMIPLLTLGIPGDAVTAILLGGRCSRVTEYQSPLVHLPGRSRVSKTRLRLRPWFAIRALQFKSVARLVREGTWRPQIRTSDPGIWMASSARVLSKSPKTESPLHPIGVGNYRGATAGPCWREFRRHRHAANSA